VIVAKIPPYWIASFAAQLARSGLIPFSAPGKREGRFFVPETLGSSVLRDPERRTKTHVWHSRPRLCRNN
jgi:hypothetical protein